MARTKLTPAVRDLICSLIAQGVPLSHAAKAAGIHKSTALGWLAKGERATHGANRDFFDAVTRAREDSIAGLVAQVREAAAKDWRAAAWLLARISPDDFTDPARRHEMKAGQARSRVIVAESEERLEYMQARRLTRQELETDGKD